LPLFVLFVLSRPSLRGYPIHVYRSHRDTRRRTKVVLICGAQMLFFPA
jgi:hypothetical protein